MIKPVCAMCKFIANSPAKPRPCSRIPIIHKDMVCVAEGNAVKDNVTGESYAPFCEEVNRHGECLVYYPVGLEAPSFTYFEEDKLFCLYGNSQLLVTTDGTDPSAKTKPVGSYDEEKHVWAYEFHVEHSCVVKAACILDGVVSDIVEEEVSVQDVPEIEFDSDTSTVSIKSYNKVFYTLDGSAPDENSLEYTAPFTITENTLVKAISVCDGFYSEIVSKQCDTIEAPVIKFDKETNTVTIESDDTVLFSTDGSDIFDDADEYTAPFVITENTLVKAAAIVDGVLSTQVELECRVPTKPVIEYDEKKRTVKITSDDEVLFTVDGTDVKKKSEMYQAPFTIKETTTVKAKSIVDGKFSEQAELVCEVVPVPEITFDDVNNMVSMTGDNKILYSLDGSDIYDDSDEYTDSILLEKNTLVKAACVKDGHFSDTVSKECKVLNTPEISYDNRTKTVTISAENPVLYTTDGSDVRKKDLEYTKPFKIAVTSTIKAKAILGDRLSEQAELTCVV